ncbi:hypothetical protein MYMA111404_00870 [Mycoplasma marinum]|uniref:Uncharacterized protein n=1 Tax=Mycoplasma marinum TaxID=1937190 RepID=A0A4R0XTY4_9MOLU|nr:hypothetical protein [Mycoplasma marinum]TCG11988.1 hypothetical protein C4B24_00025 [Mycoplasma marinum]
MSEIKKEELAKNTKNKPTEVKKAASETKEITTKSATTKTVAKEEPKKEVNKKPIILNVNFTVSKKGLKKWTVKKDGVVGYTHHKTKAEAFAIAERKIREVKGRQGRIKIHEDGKYTSNWLIEANKQAKLASGSQDTEIITLLKEQKAKILELSQVRKVTKKEDAMEIAKEAREEAKKANEAIVKNTNEHEELRKADSETNKEVAELKTEVANLVKENKKIKNSSRIEEILLIVIFVLVVAMFIYITLVATDVINAPWK